MPAGSAALPQGRERLRALAAALLLAGFVIAVYHPVTGFSFLEWDDAVYVTRNPRVRAGLTAGAGWVLTALDGGNWHPLTMLSHVLDVHLYGLDPAGHHRTNLILHLGATLLLFATLRRLTGNTGRSLLAAGLFGVHPLRAESVAWVAERKDVLSALLWMSTMAAYLHYVRRPGVARYFLLCSLFALGLAAKPMLVTLPVVLLLLDWWPLGRIPRSGGNDAVLKRAWALLPEKIVLFLLAAGSAAATIVAQRRAEGIDTLAAAPLGVRGANALLSAAGYLRDSLFPAGLAFYYPYPTHFPPLKVAGAALLLAGLTALAVFAARRTPALLTGWLWFAITILPVIGLVKVGLQASADRYTYLPSVGLGLAVLWSAPGAWWQRPRLQAAAAAAAALALLVLAFATGRQLATWRDTESLTRHALAVTKGNWVAQYFLGFVQLSRNELPEAIANLEAVTRVNPDYAEAWSNLGNAYVRAGRAAEAEAAMRLAVRLDPTLATARFNLGFRLLNRGDRAGALEQHDALRRLDPALAESLGRFLAAPGPR